MLCAQRVHTYNEPLERDLTTYAVIADSLLDGRALYSDLWDHKPPAIHLVYAAAQLIAGYGPASVYLLWVAAAATTLLGVYFAALFLTGSRVFGLLAAAFWTIICGNLELQANQPNVEVFLNACVIWVLVILLRSPPAGLRPTRAVACGLLLGLAILFKLVALSYLLLPLAHLLLPSDRCSRPSARGLYAAAVMVAACAVAAVSPAIYFAITGRFEPFFDAMVSYNRGYAGNILYNFARGLHPDFLFHRSLRDAVPLIVAAGLVFLSPTKRLLTRNGGLLATYALANWIAIAAPGRHFPHYYQLWLPFLAVAASFGLSTLRLRRTNRRSPGRRQPSPLQAWPGAAMVIGSMIYLQFSDYRLTSDQWCKQKYGSIFVESKRVGLKIGSFLAEDETFFAFGAESGLYYSSRKKPPSGVIYNYPLIQGPLRDQLAKRVVRQLATSPPELLVVSGKFPRDDTLGPWLESRYSPLVFPEPTTRFRFYSLRGGRLEKRAGRTGDLVRQSRGLQEYVSGLDFRTGDVPAAQLSYGFTEDSNGRRVSGSRSGVVLGRSWEHTKWRVEGTVDLSRFRYQVLTVKILPDQEASAVYTVEESGPFVIEGALPPDRSDIVRLEIECGPDSLRETILGGASPFCFVVGKISLQ